MEKQRKEIQSLAGRVDNLEVELDSIVSQNKFFKKELEKVKQKPRLTTFEKWSIRGFWLILGLIFLVWCIIEFYIKFK